MRHKLLYTASIFVICTSAASVAEAAGFYIQEQGAAHQGLSFAGAAADPVDASTVYYNPSAMTFLSGPQINMGGSVIAPFAKIKDAGSTAGTAATGFAQVSFARNTGATNPYEPTPIPHFYAALPVSADQAWWLGFGVSAPFGLANEYDKDFFGRYDSIHTSLKVVDYQPSIAWKMSDKLSIGGGLNYQTADAVLENAIPSPATAGGPRVDTDGQQNLSGKTASVGYNLAAFYTPTDKTRIGLTYRSQINHDLSGRVIIRLPLGVAGGGTHVNIPGGAELALPDMATLAVAHDVNDKWTVQGHVIRFNWSVFDDIPVALSNGASSSTLQNYRDTTAVAIGAKYKWDQDLTLTAGYQFDQTPTRDNFRSTRTPDGNRNWFSAGANYKLTDKISPDLSGTYINVGKEDINLTRTFPTVGNSNVRIRGTTEADIGIIAVGLSYKF